MIYSLIYMIVGSFFLINLFVGVTIDKARPACYWAPVLQPLRQVFFGRLAVRCV